jgi:hypothetical protein
MRLNASDEARPMPNLDSRPVEMLFGFLDCPVIVRAHDHQVLGGMLRQRSAIISRALAGAGFKFLPALRYSNQPLRTRPVPPVACTLNTARRAGLSRPTKMVEAADGGGPLSS